jgi:hypothetical protein
LSKQFGLRVVASASPDPCVLETLRANSIVTALRASRQESTPITSKPARSSSISKRARTSSSSSTSSTLEV